MYAWYKRYLGRTNTMKATSALAHKVAEGLYVVAARGEPYCEEKAFGQEESHGLH